MESAHNDVAPAVRADRRTPVTILTGFLGSGKTTLLNRALRASDMARVAVVINEFGEVSIDHALLTPSDDTIMVLENGCLCCTVFGDLIQTFSRLYHARAAGEIAFDHVLVETSGLADLPPVLQAFLSDPTLAGLYRVGCVISTVDAVNADTTLSNHDISVRQVALADYILLTKLDLLPPEQRSVLQRELTRRLRSFNSNGRVCPVDDPSVDVIKLLRDSVPDPCKGGEQVTQWLSHSGRAEHEHSDPSTAHQHDSTIVTFHLIRESSVPREALHFLLSSIEQQLGPSLLRVKGLVNVAEDPEHPAIIQGAQHLLHNLAWLDQWPTEDRRTRIVFITQGIAAGDLQDMIGTLDRVAHRTALARQRAAGTP